MDREGLVCCSPWVAESDTTGLTAGTVTELGVGLMSLSLHRLVAVGPGKQVTEPLFIV